LFLIWKPSSFFSAYNHLEKHIFHLNDKLSTYKIKANNITIVSKTSTIEESVYKKSTRKS